MELEDVEKSKNYERKNGFVIVEENITTFLFIRTEIDNWYTHHDIFNLLSIKILNFHQIVNIILLTVKQIKKTSYGTIIIKIYDK